MSLLDRLERADDLSALSRQFAALLYRKAEPERAATVALTAALLAQQQENGQSCVLLRDWAGKALSERAGMTLPDAAGWAQELRACRLVGDGTACTPLVLDAAGRAYLYRYYQAERRIVAQIRSRLLYPPEEADFPALAPAFRELFPPASAETDWQAVAAVSCLRRRFTVISGGPGTGKTTTLIRVVALLLQRDGGPQIALAAPTGKAAKRMAESIAAQVAGLPVSEALRARIPREARTLHSLLSYNPGDDRFRYNARRLLPLDALIIDETSMVDLLLMEAVFEALPPRARVILVGDSGQLASVETGYVLGDVCRAAGAGEKSAGFSRACATLTGRALPAGKAGPALRDAVVELQVNWRFQSQPGISSAAKAARLGDAAGLLRILESGAHGDLAWTPAEAARTPAARVAPMAARALAVLAARSPEEALARLSAFRILCAVRRGPWGVEGLNRAVEQELDAQGVRGGGAWYRGRPILVTANDYTVRLLNGDLGICWPDAEEEGRTVAWFADSGGMRRVALAKLPPHETAWAMTVHKSQGSEFDHVLLALPDEDGPILTRELLYTGLTRARRGVHLLASAALLRAALGRTAVRASGLCEALET